MTRHEYLELWQRVGVLFGRTPDPNRLLAAYHFDETWLASVPPATGDEAVRDLTRVDQARMPSPAVLHAAIRTRQRAAAGRHREQSQAELDWTRADDTHVAAMIAQARERIAAAGGHLRPDLDGAP